ncbi:MarR family winged helix-turn-helix transcriptional regulator [Ornithinimicrobium murale]|uniref:MarR family winged helix-turn-helix transcriptional regulator n=1 Tax=Ornithinimicrobium murale TaxID=1050153 RepID=UPI000E0D65F3|nr:MarR family winged helix-turn-helix transcriptional regulator [Ornithinimicrobium murale]
MTDATVDPRTSNLLGAFALLTADRVLAASSTATQRPATDTAALLLLTTTLDGTTQDTLARALGLTGSGATRLVERLVDEGLLKREPGPSRRQVSITTTPRGRAAAQAGLEERTRVCADLLDALDGDERDALTRLLEKLLQPTPTSLLDAYHICRLCNPTACGHHQGRCPVTCGVETATGA